MEFEPGTVNVGFAVDLVEYGHVSSRGLSVLSCIVVSSKPVIQN